LQVIVALGAIIVFSSRGRYIIYIYISIVWKDTINTPSFHKPERSIPFNEDLVLYILIVKNNYYRKIVTYHDTLPSVLEFCSSERWTGSSEMPTSIDLLLCYTIIYFFPIDVYSLNVIIFYYDPNNKMTKVIYVI
jgi:hypothetical protein